MQNSRTSHQRGSTLRQRGFTLPEMMVGMFVFSLLILGVVGMFITQLRLCASVTGATSATLDAANAIQRVTNSLREASGFQLMEGGAFGTTYNAIDGGGNTIAVTGIRIILPSARAGVAVGTSANPLPGGLNLTGTNALWEPKVGGATLDFYRANWNQSEGANGTPNPNTGKALWVSGTENGLAVNGPVIKSIAPSLDAVQFIQPHLPNNGPAVVNQVKVKLTSAYYDPLRGVTSSDSTTQVTTDLTGECVYLRDHNPNGASSAGVHGQSQN